MSGHPLRVLMLSADIGEGHDLPARVLADAIRERRPDAVIDIRDTIEVVGPVGRAMVRAGAEVILGRLRWLFDLQYWIGARFPPTRALGSFVVTAVARRPLRRAAAAFGADVVVTTYPLANEALGRDRRRGRLAVPLVSAITDLAGLRYWAHRGTDLHLITHRQSAAEVRRIAGPATRIAHVRGLTRPEFERPRDRAQARADLGLPADVPIALVSGGGWGVGDVAGMIAETLAADERAHVICLCGRNDPLRARLAVRFGAVDRVRLLGFTDAISDLMAAADVLVESTAGLTVLEAEIRGCHVISYGWGVGHVRLNNHAYRRFGLATVVRRRRDLAPALRAAFATPRPPDASYGVLPAAADVLLDLLERDA
jgi:UDP-N-acetylglucosamine:LPS N-acetylglucosamine transferase